MLGRFIVNDFRRILSFAMIAPKPKTVGVLALQGDFQAHVSLLRACGVQTLEVRSIEELQNVDALVIPGGESTTMSRLCDRYGLWEPLRARIEAGMGVFGTCAGLIMLATNITGGSRSFAQSTLGALDIDIARNAYGKQLDSFEADLAIESASHATAPLHAVFIRAPRIERVGEGVEVLARHNDVPVVVRQNKVMGASFHPEIAGDARLHRMWLQSLDHEEDSMSEAVEQETQSTLIAPAAVMREVAR